MTQGWRHFPHAALIGMHDGDSCEVEIDHGFGVSQRLAVRLFGISAPELTGDEKDMGAIARDGASRLAWNDSDFYAVPCKVWTWKQSFARYVGRVLIGEMDLARAIIGQGLGYAWDGKAPRRPFARSVYPMAFAIPTEVDAYDRLLELEFHP